MSFFNRFGVVISAAWMLQAGCSGDTNINSLLITDAQQDSLDISLSRAKYFYDRGDFEKARDAAEAAYAISPNNEEVAIVLGYAYLGSAGIDPFQMSKALLDQDGTVEGGAGLVAGSDADASGTLGAMSSILGIKSTDMVKLGELTENAEFPDMDVIHPSLASVARKDSGVKSLAYVNRAIEVICPFMGDDLKVADDVRHQADACPASSRAVSLRSKGNFLWAFSHLADALAFHAVLLYSAGGDGTPNIERRSKYISTNTSDVLAYLEMVTQLAEDIDAIFQTDEPDSQLNAILNSLSATSLAFAKMPSVPKKMTSAITRSLDSIKNPVASPTGGENQEGSVLKGQMNKKVAGQLSTKIDSLATDKPGEFAAKKTEICSVYTNISAGQTVAPSSCN